MARTGKAYLDTDNLFPKMECQLVSGEKLKRALAATARLQNRLALGRFRERNLSMRCPDNRRTEMTLPGTRVQWTRPSPSAFASRSPAAG